MKSETLDKRAPMASPIEYPADDEQGTRQYHPNLCPITREIFWERVEYTQKGLSWVV